MGNYMAISRATFDLLLADTHVFVIAHGGISLTTGVECAGLVQSTALVSGKRMAVCKKCNEVWTGGSTPLAISELGESLDSQGLRMKIIRSIPVSTQSNGASWGPIPGATGYSVSGRTVATSKPPTPTPPVPRHYYLAPPTLTPKKDMILIDPNDWSDLLPDIITPLPKKIYPKCTSCARELSPYLDAYHGKNEAAKDMCADCRHKAKLD